MIGYQGGRYFWQKDLIRIERSDAPPLLGEIHAVNLGSTEVGERAEGRIQLRVGNRDLTGADFVWVDDSAIESRSYPADAVLLERQEWGNFYGRMVELRRGDQVLASGPEATWRAFGPLHEQKMREREEIKELEQGEIGDVNYEIERLRLAEKRLEIAAPPPETRERRQAEITRELEAREAEYQAAANRLFQMRDELEKERLIVETEDGTRKDLAVGGIVRALRPNTMDTLDKLGLYLSRCWEFVSGDPRESNTEGGIFPAIFGTVMMVFLMAFAVVPLGVLAALYLREYAKQGFAGANGPHRGEQPRGRAVDRLRRLRARLLRLHDRRHASTGSSIPSCCRRRPTARAASSGPR